MTWSEWFDLKIMDILFIIYSCMGIIVLGWVFTTVEILIDRIKYKRK